MLSAIPSLQHPESTSFSSTDASAASNRATDLSISKQFPAANLPNPDGVLCQFEANGGECRDPACGDLHFKDFLISGERPYLLDLPPYRSMLDLFPWPHSSCHRVYTTLKPTVFLESSFLFSLHPTYLRGLNGFKICNSLKLALMMSILWPSMTR